MFLKLKSRLLTEHNAILDQPFVKKSSLKSLRKKVSLHAKFFACTQTIVCKMTSFLPASILLSIGMTSRKQCQPAVCLSPTEIEIVTAVYNTVCLLFFLTQIQQNSCPRNFGHKLVTRLACPSWSSSYYHLFFWFQYSAFFWAFIKEFHSKDDWGPGVQ